MLNLFAGVNAKLEIEALIIALIIAIVV
uniref:Vpu n=1 Tax=Human immunodeficiency virus type 1 TaxID=11676 RepID=Q08JZ2_HV1|nr:Vpu [Human immunodeficiency virus 1]